MTGRVPVPVYRGSIVYTCPRCDGDVQHAGCDDYYCGACQATWHFTQIGTYESDLDD